MSGTAKNLAGGRYVLHAPIRVTKVHPNAEPPFKEKESDAGWDITVAARCDNRAEDVYQDINTFATGLIIKPPQHFHLEIFPHPSLYKAGYTLTGPIVINPQNEDELIIPLLKYKEVEDLELPFRAAIMVLRSTEYAVINVGVAQRKQRIVFEDQEPEYARPPPKAREQGNGRAKKNHMF